MVASAFSALLGDVMCTRVAFQPLGLALLACLSSFVITSTAAHAEFVCRDHLTGGDGGADAAGAATNENVACGTDADASGGPNSANTATGKDAMAIGDGSNNTATGHGAIASGNGSVNTATGRNANASGERSVNTATGYASSNVCF